MKYYKLTITGGGYDSIHNGSKAFELGKIYPEDCTLGNTCNVGTYAKYSSFWIKVPAGEYFVQEGKMPEYFAIKRVEDNPLWEKYIDWLNKKYSTNWSGNINHCFYGFGKDKIAHGACVSMKNFGEDAVKLTLEQWDKIINKTMEEEFELQKVWFIQLTEENKELVEKWHRKISKVGRSYNVGSFYGVHSDGSGDAWSSNSLPKNTQVITTEQFIKYVLNKEVMEENKEIIGWKLKEDCKQYKKAACEITNNSGLFAWTEKFDVGYDFRPSSPVEGLLEQAGVLELWFEPVHKEKTLKFGGYDVTFEKVTSGVRISCNGETGTFSQLEAIYNFITEKGKHFKFGSQELENFRYEDGSNWDSQYSDNCLELKIGCTTGTWDEFVAIYEKAKSML